MLDWYEASLPSGERKRRGHFSTPAQLVEQILDACGYSADHDLARIRVLDPACGSGNFLSGVARRLIASGQRRGLSGRALVKSVQRNIWGFDPDPVACFLAEMQLQTILTDAHLYPRRSKPLPFHIHQADGLTLPWEQGGAVDLFLANPPYLAARNNDLSGYRFAQSRGQTDSYLLFLSLALQVVRPGGWLALVLPDPVLARANAVRERERLLRETSVQQLWHLSGVFAAYVGAVVIVARKRPPTRVHQIAWMRGQWQRAREGGEQIVAASAHTVAQGLLSRQPGAELRYLLSSAGNPLIVRVHAHLSEAPATPVFSPLGALVSITRGEELGKKSVLLTAMAPVQGQEWYPLLRGGVDVRSYASSHAQYWIARAAIAKPLSRYLVPKLLVVKSTGCLQAALDLEGHVVLQTLYLLHLRPQHTGALATDAQAHVQQDELYFLLALLNSRFLREYVYVLHTAYKWVQPQIEQHVLAHLPVPLVDAGTPLKVQIIERAKALMCACSQVAPVVELKAQEMFAEEAGLQSDERPVLETQRRIWLDEQEQAICMLYEMALQRAPLRIMSLPRADKGVTTYG